MTSFHTSDANYSAMAQALRRRYPVRYSPVALHRRRCRHHDRNRTHRTITVDETLWDLALVVKNRHNANGGTVCVNLSEICEGAIRSWLISDGGVKEEWLSGRVPDDIAAELDVLAAKRERRGSGKKRQKRPKGIPSDVPFGFRSSEGDAAWFFALRTWCEARNLMLLDVNNGRPMVQLGPKGFPFYLDTQPHRYAGWPRRDTFL